MTLGEGGEHEQLLPDGPQIPADLEGLVVGAAGDDGPLAALAPHLRARRPAVPSGVRLRMGIGHWQLGHMWLFAATERSAVVQTLNPKKHTCRPQSDPLHPPHGHSTTGCIAGAAPGRAAASQGRGLTTGYDLSAVSVTTCGGCRRRCIAGMANCRRNKFQQSCASNQESCQAAVFNQRLLIYHEHTACPPAWLTT